MASRCPFSLTPPPPLPHAGEGEFGRPDALFLPACPLSPAAPHSPVPLLLLPLIPPPPFQPTRGEGGGWRPDARRRRAHLRRRFSHRSQKEKGEVGRREARNERERAEALPERVEAPAGLERLCRGACRRRAHLRRRFSHRPQKAKGEVGRRGARNERGCGLKPSLSAWKPLRGWSVSAGVRAGGART